MSVRQGSFYLLLVGMLVAVVLLSVVVGRYTGTDWLHFRSLSAILSVVLAFGLYMRRRPGGRLPSMASGAAVVLVCGFQLLAFVARGPALAEETQSLMPVAQGFAAGMFCIGAAVLLDGLLPARWGRHLLFGMLGAVAALTGSAGLFAVYADASVATDSMLLGGMRLPGALVLVLGGLSLLVDARLRGTYHGEALQAVASQEEVQDRSGLAAALAILLITLGATVIIWRQVQTQVDRQVEVARAGALHRFVDSLSYHARNAINLLNGVRGLFAASDNVNADEWRQYFDQVPLADQYPGVIIAAYAVEWPDPRRNPASPPSIRVGAGNVEIWPSTAAGSRARIPTVYLTPERPSTHPLLGLDLGSDPTLLSMVDRARSSGHAALSGRLEFARFRDPRSRAGFAIAMPLLMSLEPRPQGQPAVIGKSGFVYCAVDIDTIVELSRIQSRAGNMLVKIVDDANQPPGVALFRSPDFDQTLAFSSMSQEIGGRTWTVSAQFDPAALAADRSRVPLAVLAGGMFAALLLFALTWVLAGLRARALHYAYQVNRELTKAQRAQQAVTDTASAGIITADRDGNILYMNPSAARGFGVSVADTLGKPLTMLMPERFRALHKSGLERVSAGAQPHAIGKVLELAGLRADGSEFPVEILLSAWTSEEQMYFTAIITDISRRKRAESELERRARDLERSNADLEQFAYVASHDLQEPLRMVASYVQLLARRYRGQLDADAHEFIAFAVDGATRMQNLIEDLLAYSRVGRSGREPASTDVRACAERAIGQLHEAITRSGARIRILCDCKVLAIPAQLGQVFQNLIGNALKFHGSGVPEVVIDATLESGFWKISVADNGIGIEPKHQERVFAIFQRLHTRAEYSGTGIGLAICRKIIDGFGGRIWVESAGGSGCTFYFTLPASGDEE